MINHRFERKERGGVSSYQRMKRIEHIHSENKQTKTKATTELALRKKREVQRERESQCLKKSANTRSHKHKHTCVHTQGTDEPTQLKEEEVKQEMKLYCVGVIKHSVLL